MLSICMVSSAYARAPYSDYFKPDYADYLIDDPPQQKPGIVIDNNGELYCTGKLSLPDLDQVLE